MEEVANGAIRSIASCRTCGIWDSKFSRETNNSHYPCISQPKISSYTKLSKNTKLPEKQIIYLIKITE